MSAMDSTPRRLPPLSALRAFEAAARLLSFRRAAAELAVTPTAISHQVRRLEALLGVRLFERHTRRVSLTPVGRELYPHLRDSFDAMARAFADLVHRDARRPLTLSATPAFVAQRLVPNLAALRAAHPAIELRLHASEDTVRLGAGGVDAAVRYGRGGYAGLREELLLRDRFAPVCSPALGVRRPQDLAANTLLHFAWHRPAKDAPTWPLWFRHAGLRGATAAPGITFSDEHHAIQAAIAGQGVALLSLTLVADELARGVLVQPFGPTLPGFGYYFVHAADADSHPELAALRTWLRDTVLAPPPQRPRARASRAAAARRGPPRTR